MNNRDKNNIMKKILEYGFTAVVSCFLLSCETHEVIELQSKEVVCDTIYFYRIKNTNSGVVKNIELRGKKYNVGDVIEY